MSTSTPNTSVSISQANSGFPDYLDFNKMRSDVINYLGPITSTYWTDYNEHDPGITTLEALMYALLDLGYRVNWPIEDLLAQKTGAPETDFLTPAQVLGSNPFTINDYRKKLMDLKEVRNAWLKPSSTTINGVYETQLELESDPSDFATDEDWKKYRDAAIASVKSTLQSHRNLCEDFLEPVVMSKQPWFVTADIELEPGSTPPEVYGALIKTLYTFFSPVPTYYTLPQLLANNVPLDQVFAGRPYDRRPSFGFLLDSELPDLPGDGTRKIYASDVLNVLLDVTGIDAVQQLNVGVVSSGAKTKKTGFGTILWSLPLAAETLPVLSVAECRFRWFLNGQQLSWSPSTSAVQLQKTLAYSGKVLYPFGSSELDGTVPTGTYLNGLGTYYSIQKDFPEVYGIGTGGLPASAPIPRQAQAMQFKGYLLFFEQLMADFLARLANVRSLLSMQGLAAAPTGPEEDDDPEDLTGWGPGIDPQGSIGTGSGAAAATWHGDLSDVPDLDNLLLFPPGDETSVTLAYPVDARKWKELTNKGSINHEDLKKLEPYRFTHWHDRDLAVAELTLSFTVMPPASQTFALEDGKKSVFAITGIRRDIVLLSSSVFNTPSDASGAAASALYAGSSKNYYTLSVLTHNGQVGYSFTLGQSGLDYYDYVDQLSANPQADIGERTGYLLHLIERFAENYDDYARLSAGFLTTQTIAANQVGLMQQFLGQLPTLGANRGKAYNYTRQSWNNSNVSGFEQRFKAYCGIPDGRRHYLCPFEVVQLEPNSFVYQLVDKDRPRGYHVLAQGIQRTAADETRSKLIAEGHAGYLYPDFYVDGENVVQRKDGYHYRIRTCNDYFHELYADQTQIFARGKEWTLFESVQGYPSEDAARQAFSAEYLRILDKIAQGHRVPEIVVGEDLRVALAKAGLPVTPVLERAAREYPIHKTERGKAFGYQLRNKEGGQVWVSAGRFASAQDARDALSYFLLLLRVPANYFIEFDPEKCHYRIAITEVLAESVKAYPTEDEAWGPGGLQRFIAAAQTAGGWHPAESEACVWGYWVACPSEKAIHPCRYETKDERDDAMERLYDEARIFPAGEWMSKEGDDIVLRDPANQHRLASIPGDLDLDIIFDLLDALWAGLFFEDEQGLYLQAGNPKIRPAHPDTPRDRWEPELLHYGAYFPITRTKVTGAASQYRVEIKLRGFTALPGKSHRAEFCYAAWINPGDPLGSAAEAWAAYEALRPLLADKNNYRPVHDEAALLYGVELLEESAILARSIQPYWYAKMAARGLDRAGTLINMEGLNLVEHVLLRDETIPICPATGKDSNPPLTNPNFQPGADPYSFIMTVFLPAWPQRFHKKENRQLLESILQREAPAHILPRILWLTPRDMCRMESAYREWQHWLRTGKPCGDFKTTDFIKLLFNTPFACSTADNWLSEIDRLYCWADQECEPTVKPKVSEPAETSSTETSSAKTSSAKTPFLIAGTKLERPATIDPIPEKRPEKRPERKQEPPRPRRRSLWRRWFAAVKEFLLDTRERLDEWWDKLGEWGGQMLKWMRIRP